MPVGPCRHQLNHIGGLWVVSTQCDPNQTTFHYRTWTPAPADKENEFGSERACRNHPQAADVTPPVSKRAPQAFTQQGETRGSSHQPQNSQRPIISNSTSSGNRRLPLKQLQRAAQPPLQVERRMPQQVPWTMPPLPASLQQLHPALEAKLWKGTSRMIDRLFAPSP